MKNPFQSIIDPTHEGPAEALAATGVSVEKPLFRVNGVSIGTDTDSVVKTCETKVGFACTATAATETAAWRCLQCRRRVGAVKLALPHW